VKAYIDQFKDQKFRQSLIISLVVLIVSLVVNFYAGIYATERASNSVTDIILSNTRGYDLSDVFIYGSWGLIIFIAYVCVSKFKKAPYILKSISLFVLIRALFISMTHIGPFSTMAIISPKNFLNYFVFGGDLFFSGHTGLPFLMSLIFWENKRLRYLFLGTSIFFGIVVLLAHLHYTIDVFSAFFITYGIFHISEKVFKSDRDFFINK
jgi:PAP2 superfamily C-terminal